MSDKQDSIRVSQVLAGALAAVTAALIGSTMGVAGTVAGAGVASVVSTVGGALYLRSIQRTREGVRTVRKKVSGRTLVVTEERGKPAEAATYVELGIAGPADSAEPADSAASAEPAGTATSAEASARQEPDETAPAPTRRLSWPAIVVGSVLAFALGMLAITGVEWLRGGPLSGGEGTSFGNIVRPQHGAGGDRTPDRDENGPDTSPSSNPTVTGTQPPTTTTTPTEPSAPPSDSNRPTTTTPPTTTGGEPSGEPTPPPAGTPPPDG